MNQITYDHAKMLVQQCRCASAAWLQAALRVFEGMRVIDLDTSLAMRAAQAAISKAEEGAAC